MHEDNADAVALFVALGTQWQVDHQTGALEGIRYEAIEPTARLAEIALDPAIFNDLRIMESAVRTESFRRARERADEK